MNFQKYLVPAGAVVAMGLAWQTWGVIGLALVATGLVTWVMLHFTRALQVLKRAADRPVGFVASAIMLNAKLKKGVSLLHVVAMTKSLGEQQSPKDTQPEVFRWTDGGKSRVDCVFQDGKLVQWTLTRPDQTEEGPAP
ncbi:MAG: glycerate kinase [Betaproteobacteria bacterium]|jgi:hypothetical protein|nr:glycerate kinase [Betaproteobacteria bacterium]MBP6646068.1 glycerate kinase [Burkholderiaceae bacterium]